MKTLNHFVKSKWTKEKLATYIDIKHGYGFKGEYFTDEPTDYVLLTPGNFKIGGGFKDDKLKFYDGPTPDEYVLSDNEIIITMTDLSKTGDTLGYPARVPHSDKYFYLHNQRLGLITFNKSNSINKKFLYYLLCCPNYRHHVLASATGTTVKHTAPSRILNFKFSLPSFTEQNLIGTILQTIDNKIDLNNKSNSLLDSLAQSLFHSWFVSFDPFKNGEFEESELGKIPKGWKIASVKDFGSIITGKTPSKENKNFYGKDIPFIKTPDMIGNIFVIQTGDSLSVLGAESQKKCTLPKDSIIVNCIGARTGFVSITTEVCQTNQQINAIILKNTIYRELIYFSMRNLRETLRAAGSGGSTMINVNKTTFSNLKLVKPPQHVVEEFSDFSFPLFNKIRNNLQENILLSSHRDLLLPQLLSGKLRVNNLEKFLEE